MNRAIDGVTGMSDRSTDLSRVPAILSVAFSLTVTMIVVVVLRIIPQLNGGIRSVRLVDWMHVIAGVCVLHRDEMQWSKPLIAFLGSCS